MSTLLEIESAVATLPPEQQEELFRFIAGRLHPKMQPAGGALRAEFPIVRCAPGVTIQPTKEQLSDV